MRVTFMGTPAFSVPVLKALVDAGHEIACVYSQPPRPAGRGKKERPSPVHALATDLGLMVRTPVSFKDQATRDAFRQLDAEVAVVVAYGLILPQAVLDAPTRGCLNIHASLLPRWRGAAPIHRAIMAGDAKTGVCIMQMEAGLDTGPVLARRETEIGSAETTVMLHDRLSEMGASLLIETLSDLDAKTAQPQSAMGVTYAHKIDKSEARVDWSKTATEVDRQIRGLSPFPGAWTRDGETRIKFLSSKTAQGSGAPGTVLLDPLRVVCGDGAVQLLHLQRAGKGVQDAAEFLRGWPLKEGVQL